MASCTTAHATGAELVLSGFDDETNLTEEELLAPVNLMRRFDENTDA